MTNFNNIYSYDLLNLLRLARDIVVGKLFISTRIRKIRLPYYIIGKKKVQFGKQFTAGINLRLEVLQTTASANPYVQIGDHVKLNDYVHIGCVEKVVIGNHVLVGSNVIITDHNHGVYSGHHIEHDSPLTPPDLRRCASKPVLIQDNVWIGDFVAVLPGSSIGEGSIIGAMSVVNSHIPAYSIAVGSPAKVIKRYNFETACWEKV